MKVTNFMIMKWSKAALLIIFGIIFIIYMDPVNVELRDLFSQVTQGHELPGLFDLGYVIYFIIAIWCFVDAVLNILTSFREQKLTIDDLAAKLDAIEKKVLSSTKISQVPMQPVAPQMPMVVQQESVGTSEPSEVPTPAPPTDVPPPP